VPANPTRWFLQALGGIGSDQWNPSTHDEPATYGAWQPLLGRYESTQGPCLPCNTAPPAGWGCHPHDAHRMRFCNFMTPCQTNLPCPGGCEAMPTGQPDVCH